MILKIVSEDSLSELKANVDNNYLEYSGNFVEYLNSIYENLPFLDTKYSINTFELDVSSERPQLTDFENVKRVYENLKCISNSDASDERLWAWLCIDQFIDYVQYRWGINGNHTSSDIRNHFFFSYGFRRSYTRNALARLWWIGRLTYDENRSDPYELTEFVCKNQDIIQHILERSVSNNLELIKPLIQAIMDQRNKGIVVNTNDIADLMKYYNLLGSTYVLDYQSEEWLYDRIIVRIDKQKKRDKL